MKIAVLLFGHLRDFESCVGTLRINVLNHYDCDVFMHTWDETEPHTHSWHGQRTERRVVDEELQKIIREKYNPTSLLIEHQELPEQEQIIELPSREVSFTGVNFMFQSMRKANELRKQHERDYGFLYDYILVTRPDVRFFTPINIWGVFSEAQKIGLDISRVRFFAHEGASNPIREHYLVMNGGCDLLFMGKPNVIDEFISINSNIDSAFIKSHIINTVSVFVSKELENGLLSIPFSYARGLDWDFSANSKAMATRSSSKSNLYKKLIRLISYLLKPIFKYEMKHPKVNYYKW